jgi:potassium-dependent mechanosensitive channel
MGSCMPWIRRQAALVAAALAILLDPAAARAVPAAADPATARATEPQPGAFADPAQAARAAVPLPLIVGASEQALASLARIERAMRGDAELDRIAEVLPDEERKVARLHVAVAAGRRALDADRELLGLERELVRTEGRVGRVASALEGRARQVQAFVDELRTLQARWDATASSPDLATAPPRARARAAEAVQRIAEVEGLEDGYVSRLVDLQDRVAGLRLDLASARAAVDEAQLRYERQLFQAESTPLWSALGQARSAVDETRRAGAGLAIELSSIAGYLASTDANPLAHLALFLAIAAALWALRRALASDPRSTDAATARLFRHPILSALVVALVCVPAFERGAPPRLVDAALLLATVPFTVLAVAALPRPLAPPVAVLALLIAVDQLILLGPGHTACARLVLLSACLAGVAVVLRGVRRGGWVIALGEGRSAAVARAGLWCACVLLAVAALANVLGNVTLALRLQRGAQFGAASAVLAAGIWRVAAGAIHVTLRLSWVQRFRLVRLHAPLLELRSVAASRWLLVAAWGWSLAAAFRVSGPVLDGARAVLRRKLEVGSLAVSLGDVMAFAVVLVIAVQLARLVGFLLDEGVLPSLPLARGLPDAISKTTRYLLVGVGAVAALYASGIELSRFSLLAGTLGVGIGFGLQNIVNNFVSGLILLYERPVQVGDAIEVGTLVGEIRRIGIRSSTVRTYQGADVIVPNGTLIQSQLVNWTLTDRARRVDIAVGVAYGSDPEQVRRLLLAAIEGRSDALPRPAPIALFTGFGDSALAFELRFWASNDRWVLAASEVREVILRELGRAGISIPFPQRDVHVRAEGSWPVAPGTRNAAVGAVLAGDRAPTPEQGTGAAEPRRDGGV